MPILRLDKLGNVVEADARLDGDEFLGRSAEMTDSGDVTELSIENTADWKKSQKDRAALEKIRELNRANMLKKIANEKRKLQQKKFLDDIKKEALWKKRQAENAKRNSLAAKRQILAARSAALPDGTMSGVSGFGLTADGRRPILSRASVDWQPIETADYAFGGSSPNTWEENWGFGMEANTSQLGETPVTAAYPKEEWKGECLTSVADLKRAGVDAYTERMAYDVERFKEGTYATVFRWANTGGTSSIVFDEQMKSSIQNMSAQGIGQALMTEYIKQGWGWSGYEENGKFVEVKIPYIYGLPYDRPECGIKPGAGWGDPAHPYYRDNWRKRAYHSQKIILNGEELPPTYFNLLKPLIKALALKFDEQYAHLNKALNEEAIKQEIQHTAKEMADAEAFVIEQKAAGIMSKEQESFFDKILKFLKGGVAATQEGKKSDYRHPMLKEGLIK